MSPRACLADKLYSYLSMSTCYSYVAAFLLFLYCGSITRDVSQAWVVATDPPGAEVELSTGRICTTPCSLELPRKHGFAAAIDREGHEPVTADVASGTSGGGAVIGIPVDAATGASKGLTPNPLRVTLVPLPPETDPLPDDVAPDAGRFRVDGEGVKEAERQLDELEELIRRYRALGEPSRATTKGRSEGGEALER